MKKQQRNSMLKENEIYKYCRRCHRELKDIESTKLGYGPICYRKYINSKKNYLFEIGGIIDEKANY